MLTPSDLNSMSVVKVSEKTKALKVRSSLAVKELIQSDTCDHLISEFRKVSKCLLNAASKL